MSNIPFTLSKRKDSNFYYVRFKTESGKYLTAISTKQTDKKQAEKIAWEWFRKGEISKPRKKPETIQEKAIKAFIRQADISNNDLDYVIQEMKRRGIIKSIVYNNGNLHNAESYFLDFWTWEKSPYIKEKLRKNHTIGKRHVSKEYGNIKNYWLPFLRKNKIETLEEITKQNVRQFVDEIAELPKSFGSKNDIVRAGTTALKYAFNNELIPKDITQGIVYFSGKYNEREILTPEIVQALFNVQWNDERAKLANMLAMCTGLRAGEIQGLRLQDLGQDRLYINHSWNLQDGLKCTKNGESRTVFLPFTQLIEALKNLANNNPYDSTINSFVFWATIPGKPMESKTWLYELRQALQKVGMSKAETKKYCFHAWRHFYSTYMSEHVNQKALQKQTGHKTISMLEHYAEHETLQDIDNIKNAQIALFGNVVNKTECFDFDYKKLNGYVKVEYKTVGGKLV